MLDMLKESINSVYGEDIILENVIDVPEELKDDVLTSFGGEMDSYETHEFDESIDKLIEGVPESQYSAIIDRMIDAELEKEDTEEEGVFLGGDEDEPADPEKVFGADGEEVIESFYTDL